jgi:protein LSM14
MTAPLSYIGSQISLISKSDIRYEGTLHSIQAKEHTVSLSSVKSFGTEGRRGDGQEIPPSNEVYGLIIFRGSDIKDLTVIKSAAPQLRDPAIIRADPVETQDKAEKAEEPPKREPSPPRPVPEVVPATTHSSYSRQYNRRGGRPRRPNFREPHGELKRNTNESLREEFDEEFDFTAANQRLEKQDIKEEEEDKHYNKKSSFFDNISYSKGESRLDYNEREKQKLLDRETFGPESVDTAVKELRNYIFSGNSRGRRGYRRGRNYRRPRRSG